MDYRAHFERLLDDRLIPEFCNDTGRRLNPAGFKRSSIRVSDEDCRYFVMAWQAEIVRHLGRGMYRASLSAASEQFFWEGSKAADPRPFWLWLEPVITVGGLGRLHFDHGWPSHLIGTQSTDWAFDIVARLPNGRATHIAGEVKKSEREIDDLVGMMVDYGRDPPAPLPAAGKRRNAFKKVAALRRGRAPIFWALGPAGRSDVFRVSYKGDIVSFARADDRVLDFPSSVET